MDTNFYYHPSSESPLKPFGVIHIGKRIRWNKFMFHGYNQEASEKTVDIDRYSGLSIKVSIPECIIESFMDWREVFSKDPECSTGGYIENEYGSRYNYADFIAMVRDTDSR